MKDIIPCVTENGPRFAGTYFPKEEMGLLGGPPLRSYVTYDPQRCKPIAVIWPTNGQPCQNCCVTESTSLSQPRSELDSRIRNTPSQLTRRWQCLPKKWDHIYSREYRVHVLGSGGLLYKMLIRNIICNCTASFHYFCDPGITSRTSATLIKAILNLKCEKRRQLSLGDIALDICPNADVDI